MRRKLFLLCETEAVSTARGRSCSATIEAVAVSAVVEAGAVQQSLRQKLLLLRDAGVVLMREAGGWYQSVCLVPPISELDFF